MVDGDTIVVDGERVRLEGIDAPEKDQSCGPAGKLWACGEASTEHLRAMLAGGMTSCSWEQRDRYGRALGTCRSHAGRQVNSAMVEDGMAAAYLRYSRRYEPEQTRARESGAGMWSGPFDMPWEHRKKGRGE